MYYLFIGQVFNLNFEKEKQRGDLLAFQENLFYIKFHYQGIDYTIYAKLNKGENEKCFSKIRIKSKCNFTKCFFPKKWKRIFS